MNRLFSKIKRVLIDPFICSQNPPWYDARGVLVGLVVGAGIPLGAQMISLGLLRLVLRFNMLAAFAFTWINNPLSVGPMYYGFYLLGSFLLNRPPIGNFQEFYILITPILEANNLLDGFKEFLALGSDIMVRWFVGAFTTAIPLGLLGYFVSLRIQTIRALKRLSSVGPVD